MSSDAKLRNAFWKILLSCETITFTRQQSLPEGIRKLRVRRHERKVHMSSNAKLSNVFRKMQLPCVSIVDTRQLYLPEDIAKLRVRAIGLERPRDQFLLLSSSIDGQSHHRTQILPTYNRLYHSERQRDTRRVDGSWRRHILLYHHRKFTSSTPAPEEKAADSESEQIESADDASTTGLSTESNRNGIESKLAGVSLKGRSIAPYPESSGDSGEAVWAKRPSTAPKPQLDIKSIIRYHEEHSRNCTSRNLEIHAPVPNQIRELRERINQRDRELHPFRGKLKVIEGQISGTTPAAVPGANKSGMSKEQLLAEARDLKAQIHNMLEESNLDQERIVDLAFGLPNLSKPEVPSGPDARLIDHINEHLRPSFQTPEKSSSSSSFEIGTPGKSHVDIGRELDILDFTGSAKTSGWGWYFLKNEAAFLEQALIQYALSVARNRGWTVMTPPSMVYSHIAAACGFQPRDRNNEEHVYRIQQPITESSKSSLVMTGTAEIPFAGMNASAVLERDQLPLKVIGVSRCYRAEAGGRGADTKGLYRVHEFTKVEMFAWTLPEVLPSPSLDRRNGTGPIEEEEHNTTPQPSSSNVVFREMLDIQKEILSSLGLYCRILEMPASDLGASAARKQDIEAYFPSRRLRDQGFGEVTSASQCTDYQTRRLNTRYRKRDSKLDFPHTVNGTALAVPRVLAAILENGWNEERGTVTIPEVLRPWMGGASVIDRKA